MEFIVLWDKRVNHEGREEYEGHEGVLCLFYVLHTLRIFAV
jgi:hypothetical protein